MSKSQSGDKITELFWSQNGSTTVESYENVTTIMKLFRRHPRFRVDLGLLFNSINDNCIENILLCMPFKVQVQMARASNFICRLMEGIWRRSTCYTTLWLEDWRTRFTDDKDFIFFLHLMLAYITKVNITSCLPLFLLQISEMGIAYFPHVEMCVVNEHSTLILVDEYLGELRNVMPRLRRMHLITTTTGRNICKFDCLEELSVFDNHGREYEIDNCYMARMCFCLQMLRVLDLRFLGNSQLDLTYIQFMRNLEVLRCNLLPLRRAFRSILTMQRLKVLQIFLDEGPLRPTQPYDLTHSRIGNNNQENSVEFYRILNQQAKRIIGIAMDIFFLDLDHNWSTDMELFKYNKMQMLAFNCLDFYDPVVAKFSQMPDLHTVSFRYYEQLTGNVLWDFVVNCRKLNYLDVSFCKHLDKDLLMRIHDLLRSRGKSITLYYRGSGFEQDIKQRSHFWFNEQSNVVCSIGQPPNAEIGTAYVSRGYQFEFIPLEEINKDPNADEVFKPIRRTVSELRRIFS